MTEAHVHFERLLAAFSAGHSGTADVLRRILGRNNDESTEQHELLLSLEFLETLRHQVEETLDSCERGGFAAIAKLCRDVVKTPLCTFTSIQQWGVCALTGRTVNRMVLITTDTELSVDESFATFLTNLWSVSHLELIECARAELRGDDDIPHGDIANLVASYVLASEDITKTMQLTLLALDKHRCAAGSQNLQC